MISVNDKNKYHLYHSWWYDQLQENIDIGSVWKFISSVELFKIKRLYLFGGSVLLIV